MIDSFVHIEGPTRCGLIAENKETKAGAIEIDHTRSIDFDQIFSDFEVWGRRPAWSHLTERGSKETSIWQGGKIIANPFDQLGTYAKSDHRL